MDNRGLVELDAMIARIRKLPELAKSAAPEVARAVELELRRTIAAGTTPDGKPWPAKKSGGKPLVNAAEALAVAAVGSTVVVRLHGPEARHHLGWAKGGIVRQVIPVKDVPPAMAAAIKAVLAKRFSAVVAALLCFVLSCAAALHVIRTLVDIADDLCVSTLSDKNLDPAMVTVLAGRTPQEACKDVAVVRPFVDQVKAAQRASLASLRRMP